MKKKLLFILIFINIFASGAYSAVVSEAVVTRNIFQLFTDKNPKLESGTAKKYVDILMEAAKKYKQDPYIIASIIVHESTVNNKAVSKGGDYGLMQVRYKVHEKAIKKEYPKVKKASDMFDAKTNIFFGTRIFSECAAKSKDLRGALLRYTGNNNKAADKVMKTYNELKSKDKNNNKNNTKRRK